MDLKSFQTRAFGKWILAGEHTVLRGGRALVFPLRDRFLDFEYSLQSTKNLEIEIPQGYPEEFKLLFWSVFEKACALQGLLPNQFQGLIKMKANIPIGSGLGASAALCVALARWFESLQLIQLEGAFEFAKTLEDLFHGESSGVDVAVVLSEQGLLFQRNGPQEQFKAQWQPQWYLSHSGQKGITKECVQKVQALGIEDPERLTALDDKMKKAVGLCLKGLLTSEQEGLPLLVLALQLGNECFYAWDLVNSSLGQHMQLLQKAGALAVKPTGSGLGGYVLSLWNQQPSVPGVEFLKATVIDNQD